MQKVSQGSKQKWLLVGDIMPWRPILENIRRKNLRDQYMHEDSRERRKKLGIAEENLQFISDSTKIKERKIQDVIVNAHMLKMEKEWSQDKPSKKTIQQINEDLDHKSTSN